MNMSNENATIGWGLLPSYKLGALCSAQEILRNSCASRTYSRTLGRAGLRVSEIVALKITHIDSGNMQCLIEKAKGKKDRYVNLPESILDQLRDYFKEYRPKEFLFEGQYGGQYSIRSAQAVFKQAMSKAKINKEIGIHGLRHSYATHLMEAGTDIGHIQKLLGHADISTTLIYAKVTNRDTKKVKSPLDSL
jgi:site-specific recombinase XerD